jgi:carboxymethylenebutenolidase
MQGTLVDIGTDDGIADCYVAQPPGAGPFPAVLFYPDGIGVRPRLYDMADRIASTGYVVLLPNVFYRAGRIPLIPNLEEILKLEDRTRLMEALAPIMSHLKPADVMRDTRFYLDYLAGHDAVAAGPIGVTGYCMGAGMSLRAAGTYPDRIAAAAGFHGGNLATDAEDSPHLCAATVRAELYFGHADQDRSLPPEQMERLNAALDAAGVGYRAQVYEGASHGYTMADTQAYHEQAEQRHWTELLGLFDRVLRPSADQ